MSLELLTPVDNEVLESFDLLPKQVLGKSIIVHTKKSGLPEIKGLNIVLIGCDEYRNSFFPNTQYNINDLRKCFYKLYPGNWNLNIADLGNLPNGAKVEDTYFALKEIAYHLKHHRVVLNMDQFFLLCLRAKNLDVPRPQQQVALI